MDDEKTKISLQELVDCYKESLGEEGAAELLNEAIRKAALARKKYYTKEEAIRILNILSDEEGFIGILAGIIIPRIIIRNCIDP